jgi:hypothetical protein
MFLPLPTLLSPPLKLEPYLLPQLPPSLSSLVQANLPQPEDAILTMKKMIKFCIGFIRNWKAIKKMAEHWEIFIHVAILHYPTSKLASTETCRRITRRKCLKRPQLKILQILLKWTESAAFQKEIEQHS